MALAILLPSLTVLVRLSLGYQTGDQIFGIIFLVPITLCAYLGGPLPSFLATVVAALEVSYFLLPPLHSFRTEGINKTSWLSLIIVGTLINVLMSVLRRHRRDLRLALMDAGDLRTALDEHAIVAFTDPHGAVTEVNDRFCAISQYSREEWIGKDHRMVSSGYHSAEFIRNLWTTISQGKVWSGDIKNKAKDGTFYWVDTTVVPFLDTHGIPRRYMAIHADITERKWAEEALQTGEERNRATLDNILEGCQLIGFDWRYIYLNHAAASHNRRPNEELLGRRMTDMWPGIESTEVFAVLQACMTTRTAQHQEVEFRFADESCSWFDIRAQPVPEGVLALSIDISERQRAETALHASEERYRNSLDKVLEGCQLIGFDWRYLYLNDAAARQNRRPNTELLGQTWMQAWPNMETTQSYRMLERSMRERIDLHEEVEFPFPDGTTGWYDLRVQPDLEGIIVLSIDITARKLAELELVKAGALQSAIFNSANFSSIATDANGVIQIFNVGAERMLGYTAAEVMNRITPADISDPDEIIARARSLSAELGTPIMPGFEAMVFKASRRIEDIYELTYIRKDGSRFPAVVSVTALRDPADAIIGYLLIGTDNTARKAAENELLKAGALQRAIFNSATFSCVATDTKGVIQIFNVGAERMLGYTAAEAMNQLSAAALHDSRELASRAALLSREFRMPVDPGFEALSFKASRGIEDICELTKIRKDGSRFPSVISVTALRDAQGCIIGYLLLGTDNTAGQLVEEERMKLDQRLRDQHFYTRSLIESNVDALITTDPRGIITDVNKQTEALTGCTRDELIGAPFRNYFTDADRADAGIARVLNEGKVTDYELTARARDGTLTSVSYNATTFHDRDRKLQGVFAAARDVTELKRYERTLQQNIELENASRMKSEFLATMSHELRTPLNAIIGFSEVLRDGLVGELTPQQRAFIGDIFGSGQHLLALINDILDLSKVEAGKMTLDLEPVELDSLFSNSLSIVREKAATSNLRLVMTTTEDLGSIQADARKFKQILYNLLSNAVKFTPEGGQITLHAGRVQRSAVGELSGGSAGRGFPLAESGFTDFLLIRVSDTGIGISPDGLEHLFRPFSQIDNGLARKFEGTGLGLAMVKQLVELHGGTVAVESAEGVGSSFSAWLPIREMSDERAPGGKPGIPLVENGPSVKRTALVIEDDYKAAELIRLQLEAEGFEVLHAATAESAIALAVQQPLALITLDIMLPDMDGWDLLRRFKEEPELRRIPVVIISIVAERNKGFALGAAAVIEKPISRQELYEALVDLGLFPTVAGRPLKVLIVDDDPRAVELIAVRIIGLADTVLRAYSGSEAIDIARKELPDLIVLDLMMPEVNGFMVVAALSQYPETAGIPILVVTAKRITREDRARLQGSVTTIMEKSDFDRVRFIAEVRRAMSGRQLVT